MHVVGWLERAATARPDGCALECSEGTLSYSELLLLARGAAATLRARGVTPGQPVAIALPAGRDFVIALHGCLLLGATAVPVDLRLTASERERISAGALLVDEPLGAAPATDIPQTGGRHDLDATAVVIHTSGTTSAPKPVELTYGNFLWSAFGSAVALGCEANERWLCTLPLSHVGGLSILMRSVIYATTAVLHERFETDRALRALQEQDVTLVSLVATTLARLLDAGLEHPPALRCALTGGGPIPAALLERARSAGVNVSQTYGLTEACSQVTTTPIASLRAGVDGAGPPLFCTRLRVAPDGEIMIAGPTVAPTSAADDGWLHTGDLGALDEHGHLSVTGRKSETIITGGENVTPTEVEAVLEAHPLVFEAAVIGRPDPDWGEAIAAIIVLSDGGEAPAVSEESVTTPTPSLRAKCPTESHEETLRAHCAAALAPYKVPKSFTFLAEPLPRTASGKLLRRELV
jgi:O-succinylbenzoic acid--CoA ligase